MRFSDYKDAYNNVFPKATPKPTRVVETPLGKKDIEEEHKEEIIDSKVELPKETPKEETPNEVNNGDSADN